MHFFGGRGKILKHACNTPVITFRIYRSHDQQLMIIIHDQRKYIYSKLTENVDIVGVFDHLTSNVLLNCLSGLSATQTHLHKLYNHVFFIPEPVSPSDK